MAGRSVVTGRSSARARSSYAFFASFASGKSPQAIAVDLNRDGVPGPLGRAWGDTSIRGHVSRGTGIVNNELYTGVLVWNRLRFVKDPSTGRRVSRINPEAAWIRTEVPHLRIVDDELWNAVRARQKDIAVRFEATSMASGRQRPASSMRKKRPVSLLSGLLTCGCCYGKYGLIMRDRYGCPQSSPARHLRQQQDHHPRKDRGTRAVRPQGPADLEPCCRGNCPGFRRGNEPPQSCAQGRRAGPQGAGQDRRPLPG